MLCDPGRERLMAMCLMLERFSLSVCVYVYVHVSMYRYVEARG